MKLKVKITSAILLLIFLVPFSISFSAYAENDFAVRYLHLSWQHDVKTTMTVSWFTIDSTSSVVQYGLTSSYGQETTDIEATWHHVEVTGLSPDTIYHYRAGNGDIWSNDYTFKTGTATNTTQFICLGDAQTDSPQRKEMVTTIDRVSMDMMLYTGDFVDTSTAIDEYYAWFKDYNKVVTETPTMGILGNHEKNSSIFYTIWAFPGREEYYSFDFGPLHIIGLHTLDTNYITDPSTYTAQADWLRADLENNTDALWTIVMMHTAAFSSFPRSLNGEYQLINETFVPIFEEYNVSLVLSGHDHAYERLFCNDVNYIISGGAGSTLYPFNPATQINISVYAESTYNFLFLEVNENKLHVRAFRPDYSFIDQLVLNKEDKPDLSFQTLPLTYKQEWDQNLIMDIVVTNTGEENITTTTKIAYTDLDTVQVFDIPPLNVGEKHTLSYSWSLGNLAQRTFSFELDYDSVLDEVSENNNELLITLVAEPVTPTTTEESNFLSGLIGFLIVLLSMILPVFVKKIRR